MGKQTDLEVLIDKVYDAGLDESGWQSTLQNIMAFLDGAGMDLYLFRNEKLLFMASYGAPEEGFEEYIEHYHDRTQRARMLSRIPAGQIYTDLHFTTEQAMRKEPYYEEFLKRWDFRHAMMVPIIKDENDLGIMAVHRGYRQGPPPAEDFEKFGVLLPHIRRSVKMQFKLLNASLHEQLYSECLDKIMNGALLLDSSGKILHANITAEKIISKHPTLNFRHGHLIIRDRKAMEWLNSALAEAINGILDQPVEIPVYCLSKGNNGAKLILYVTPVSKRIRCMESIAAILFISDASISNKTTSEAILRKLYNLTPAEVALAAALLDGLTLRQHAEERSVSFNTVRTQLRGLFNKTGTQRQPELVALLINSIGNVKIHTAE